MIDDPAVFAADVEWVPTGSLVEHPRNPRRGDVAAVRASVEANGIYRPVYAQRSRRTIVAGHHLWRVLRERGDEQVPVLWLDVSDDQALRILLADNRSTDLGAYDDRGLADLLADLQQTEAGLTGSLYADGDLDRLLASLTVEPPEPPGAFGEFDDDDVRTEHECPRCHYQWSGSTKPTE